MSTAAEALQQPAATDDNPLQPEADTLTKPEACQLLGKSERTVNTYMSSGRLAFTTVGGKVIFERVNVERLKADLETPVARGVPILSGMAVSPAVSNDANGNVQPPAAGALARIDPDAVKTVAEAFAVALRNGLRPPPRPGLEQWKTLKEAAEYSGLPKRWLVKQARSGVSWAMNIGTEKTEEWRFRIAEAGK